MPTVAGGLERDVVARGVSGKSVSDIQDESPRRWPLPEHALPLTNSRTAVQKHEDEMLP